MATSGSEARARWSLVASALLFSTGGVFIKVLTGLSAWQRAGLRSAIAALFLLAVWPKARRGYSWTAALFSLFYASTLATFVAANTYTTAANAIFLQSTAPLYVLLLSPLVLHERVRRADLLFMVALAAGLALCFAGELGGGDVAQSTAPQPRLGNAIAALSGLLWGCTIVGLRFIGRKRGDGADAAGGSVVLGNLTCFAACALLATFFGDGFTHGLDALGVKAIGALLFLGCFQVGLAYVFITRGMAEVAALPASLLLLVEPVFNPLWSFLVLHERPGAWSLAGGAVILGATAVHAWAKSRAPAPAIP